MRGKKERNEKRARSFTETHRLSLYILAWLPLRLIAASQKRYNAVTALYTVQGKGCIQLQAGSLLMILACLQNKSVQQLQASQSPSRKGCLLSLQKGRATAHEYQRAFPLQVDCHSMAHLLGFQLTFEAECYRDIDELETCKTAQLRRVPQSSMAILSILDRSRFADFIYYFYCGTKNFLKRKISLL